MMRKNVIMIIMMTRWHDDHDDDDAVDGGGGFEHKPEEMWGIAESILTAPTNGNIFSLRFPPRQILTATNNSSFL